MGAVESLEDAPLLLPGDAHAAIGDGDDGLASASFHRYVYVAALEYLMALSTS